MFATIEQAANMAINYKNRVGIFHFETDGHVEGSHSEES